MAKKPKQHGLPKQLERAKQRQEELEEDNPRDPEKSQTPEEFAKDMFGEADQPQTGLPSLDWLKEQFKTKSAAIRFLGSQGFKAKEISKHLGVRYQHARNVLTNPLKRGPNEPWLPQKHIPQNVQAPPQGDDDDEEGNASDH